MPIPEDQLETWSNVGASVTSEKTYASIRNALDAYKWPEGINREWFLQGSYANSTNVRADSDIDVVALLKSTFKPSITELDAGAKERFQAAYPDATYNWPDFRNDVLKALRDGYGTALVKESNKCIEVQPKGLLSAHIVPAVEYRHYHSFTSATQFSVDIGVAFWTKSGTMFANFPKQHRDNGAAKNKQAPNHYKPAVRMFKNARSRLVEEGKLGDGVAPSYCLECILYNCPDACFVDSFSTTFYNVLKHLQSANLSTFICQNALQRVFGDAPWQWKLAAGEEFREAIIGLWNDWK